MTNRDKYPIYFIAKLRKMHQYLCIHPTSSNNLQAKMRIGYPIRIFLDVCCYFR